MSTMEAALAPVTKSITVACSVERAFALFTDELASWWPFHSHSVGSDRVARVVWEAGTTGRVYEVHKDGSHGADWGRLVHWEPPHRLVLAWFPGRSPDDATELEVRFSAEGDGTRLELEHRAWEVRGERAAEVRTAYDKGWDDVLRCFPNAS